MSQPIESEEERNMLEDAFLPNISQWLESGQYKKVKHVILDRANISKVREHGMDIICGVCRHLNSEETNWSPEMEECCEFSLLMVAQLSNPKEVLMALQEQVASFGCSSKFKILLLPFQAVLLRLSDKQSIMLNMVLETVGNHVSSLPLPDPMENNFEGKERLLLDADPRVQCIQDIYEALAEFYAPFVKQVSLNRIQVKGDEEVNLTERRRVLKKNLLKTLGRPLVCMDLHAEEGQSPSLLRRVAEKLVNHLSSVCSDFFTLPDLVHHYRQQQELSGAVDEDEAEEDEEGEDSNRLVDYGGDPPTLQSIGTIFYLVYGEGLSVPSVPSVYSPEYVFHSVVTTADMLLKSSDHPLAVHKGLLLIQGLLKHVADESFSPDCLDHPIHIQIFQSLSWLAVSGLNIREFKVLSVGLWRPYINKLHPSARYGLLRTLLPSLEHPGLRGLIIGIIKDQIALCLDKGWPYFLQDRLNGFLPLIWKLPNDVETDLLEHMDAIMGGLNLARFLLLRDLSDVSGFTRHLPAFESGFMEPLARALSLSRVHYELELNKVNSGVSAVCNSFISLPDMPLHQQRTVIEMGINSLNLLESVLARVNECLHSFPGSIAT